MRTPDSALILQDTAMHSKAFCAVAKNKATLHALCSWAECMLVIELPNAANAWSGKRVKVCGVPNEHILV